MHGSTKNWHKQLKALLLRALGVEDGSRMAAVFHDAFSQEYQALMPVNYAVRDLMHIQELQNGALQIVDLFAPKSNMEHFRLHFYSATEHYLDQYIPIHESMGFGLIDQVQFVFSVAGKHYYVKSFVIDIKNCRSCHFNQLRPLILKAIQAILDKRLETDILNSLIVACSMNWQQVDLFRAYRNYYLQLGFQSSINTFHHALINNPNVSKNLYAYFDARFRPDPSWEDPVIREESGLFPVRMDLLTAFESVNDINDDRILRTLFNLIDATVRCNFFVRADLDDYFIAFKINSLGVIDMPVPRPHYEIYVHAFDMEGIHLRGGKVARGGIRWSDRPDDFRTEILDLMQTQMSKNALIIPKGAKGGFVIKQKYNERSEFLNAGKQAYIRLMRGMLDLTDNYVKNQVVRLPGLVTYDGDDPYLVVAADKGTATFPDIANGVAGEYNFWLQDAYASGGSYGYNHKQLGITARGAWESVKRHFREIGKDIQHESFTVVGIGSMDGDVFGNGMLLSPCIKLLAAISGQHIFIDPDPDPALSFNERQRLFELPGSSWADYKPELLSQGGGVFLRSAKDIPVSREVKNWLGIRYNSLDGETLIRYLLTAPVELLWLGGIGTYFKAVEESHEEVGDRANDRVRMDAVNIRSQVVGEGANLGFTQKARIEYSLKGGRINTDAIDNSAGVDTSDHEVNLKIMLNNFKTFGVTDSPQDVFNSVSEEVCAAVLDNNYHQSQCLSLDSLRCKKHLEQFMELAERLEAAGLLDPMVEAFPSKKQLMQRHEPVLTRPELAVLLAASKLYLKQILLDDAQFIQAEYCETYLSAYFPKQLTDKFADKLSLHPLADTVKATWICNTVLDQAGCTFLCPDFDLQNGEIVPFIRNYLSFDAIIDGHDLRRNVYDLDNTVDSSLQYQLLISLEQVLLNFSRWSLENKLNLSPEREIINRYKGFLIEYSSYLTEENSDELARDFTDLQQQGLDEQLAWQFVKLQRLHDFPLIVHIIDNTEENLNVVMNLYTQVVNALNLNQIKANLSALILTDRWQRSVYVQIQQQIDQACSCLIQMMVKQSIEDCRTLFSKQTLRHYRQLEHDVINNKTGGLLPYVVLSTELNQLINHVCNHPHTQ